MSNETGHLWAIVQEWLDAQVFRVSQRQLAAHIGVGHSTLTDWKYARTTPSPGDLRALATAIGVPYDKVLDAALIDAGYREPRTSNRAAG